MYSINRISWLEYNKVVHNKQYKQEFMMKSPWCHPYKHEQHLKSQELY